MNCCRDETIHFTANAALFKEFCQEHPRIINDEFKTKIYDMARDVVRLEDAFIDLAFGVGGIEDLEAQEVKQFMRYITDRRLLQLGLKPNFEVKDNPLPWAAELLSGTADANFFETRVSEYSKAGLTGALEWGRVFNT